MESGKPNTGGWIQLIATPLTMLAALVALTRHELSTALPKLWKSRLGKGLVAILLLAIIYEAAWISRKFLPSPQPLLSPSQSTQTSASQAFDFTLTNPQGDAITLSTLRGHPVLIVFAYSHCKTICTQIIENLKTIQHGPIPPHTQLLLITLDPWRDTPERLITIAKKWDLNAPNIALLSGHPKTVTTILKHYNVTFIRDPKTGEISHQSQWVIIDPQGKIRAQFTHIEPEWIIEALKKVSPKISK